MTIIDNLLHPILVGNRLELHTVLAFIAVVGGLILFGDRGMAALLAFRVSSWIHRPAAALLADPASNIAWLRRPHSGIKDVADSQSVALNQPRHSTRKFMISNDTQKSMLESSFRARRGPHSIRHMCGWNWLAVGLFLGAVPSFIAGTLPEPTPQSRGREPVAASELQRGPQGAHRVAVTFDAGGEADAFPALLAALAAAQVRSTFFLTGKWIRQHPDLVKLLVSSGHELGNHTKSHRDLTQLDDAEIRTEFQETAALLAQHVPRSARWWRAPFGARDSRVLRIASELGYVSIYWTLDSLDSVAPQKSRAFLVERIARHSEAQLDGAIILMHVGEPATAEALPEILRGLQRRGFEFVTISELLSSTAIKDH